MQYALLIYENESWWQDQTPEETAAMMGGYQRFGETNGARIVSGAGLQPTSTATTLRVRDGERLLTDGPFAETREQFGGFYVVEAESIDEAIELAAQIPGARTGGVEVRPVMDVAALQGAQA